MTYGRVYGILKKRRCFYEQKNWSIILLCLIVLCFALTVGTFVHTGFTLHSIDVNAKSPGEVLGGLFATAFIWLGALMVSGGLCAVGCMCSLINVKIAQNPVIRKTSEAFLGGYSLLTIFLAGMLIYVFIQCF